MKSGLDYFPLDTVLDTKFDLIEAEYGLKGFAILIKLFQKIYGEQGYYIEWNDEVSLLFARKICAGGNDVSEIVHSCIRRGIFDSSKFSEYGILTSSGIQKRYIEVARKRKETVIFEEYLLVDCASNSKNVAIISKNGGSFDKNGGSFQQSKVKESKGKGIREENKNKSKKINNIYNNINCPEQSSEPVLLILQDGSVCELTAKDIERYQKIYTNIDCYKEAKKAARWLEDNPKRRKTNSGISRFIGSWMSRASDAGGSPEVIDYREVTRYANQRSDDVDGI